MTTPPKISKEALAAAEEIWSQCEPCNSPSVEVLALIIDTHCTAKYREVVVAARKVVSDHKDGLSFDHIWRQLDKALKALEGEK